LWSLSLHQMPSSLCTGIIRCRNALFNVPFWFQVIWFAQRTATISQPCIVLATAALSNIASVACIRMPVRSQLNRPSFSQESAVCTKPDLGREYSMLPSVTTHQLIAVAVSKVGRVVLCRVSSEKSIDSIGGMYISTTLTVIKHFVNVNDNIICLSATQLYCIHGAP